MMTGDRVEAAAKAIDKELADSATGPLYIAHLEFFPERAARSALAAVDECDRVAGVVRLDLNDAAVIEIAARHFSSGSRGWQWDHVSHESDRELWRGEARDLLAALAAAGAQPPKEDHEQR